MLEWVRVKATGNVVPVIDPEHVKRLLEEGGVIVPDPRVPQTPEPAQQPLEEVAVTDVSTLDNERLDKPGTHDDKRPGGIKPAVQRSANSRSSRRIKK